MAFPQVTAGMVVLLDHFKEKVSLVSYHFDASVTTFFCCFISNFLLFVRNILFPQVIQASSGESGGDAAHFPLVQVMGAAGSCWVRGQLGLLHITSECTLGWHLHVMRTSYTLLIHGNFAYFPPITLRRFSLAELFPTAEPQSHKIVQFERDHSGVIVVMHFLLEPVFPYRKKFKICIK